MKPGFAKFFSSRLALSVLSGILVGLSFPPFHFEWLAFLGLVPFMLAIERSENYRETFKLSYFAFLALNLVAIYWIGGWSREADPFLMIGGAALMLGHPLFFAIPILVYHSLRKRFGPIAFILFPFIYLSFEHLHSISEVAFPWLTIGYSQSYNLADIQLVEFTGLFGLSLQLLVSNTLFTIAIKSLASGGKAFTKFAGWTLAGLCIVVIPQLWGLNVLRHSNTASSDSLKVALVQPNIDPYSKWEGNPMQMLEMYENESRKVIDSKPQLLIWPETAVTFYILLPQMDYYRNQLQQFVDSNHVSLLTGLPLAHYFSTPDSAKPSSHYDPFRKSYYDAYNGAALFVPGSVNVQTYGKILLVPFGERIPYADDVPFLIKPLEWGVGISNWEMGRDTTIFHLPNSGKFGTVICYESIFPDYVRRFVKKGANFIVIITNDGWFGKSSGPPQHAAYAAIRAVENRRAVVRCANTGISEVIDAYGRLIGQPTKLDVSASRVAVIPLSDRLTFYSMHGDWIAHLAEAISAVSIVIALFLKFKYKNKES